MKKETEHEKREDLRRRDPASSPLLPLPVTEVARADDDEAALVVHAEDVADLGAQLGDVVAVSLLTEFAEAECVTI